MSGRFVFGFGFGFGLVVRLSFGLAVSIVNCSLLLF